MSQQQQQQPPKAVIIGHLFLQHYYETLSFSPEKLASLYVDDAVFSVGEEADVIPSYSGIEVRPPRLTAIDTPPIHNHNRPRRPATDLSRALSQAIKGAIEKLEFKGCSAVISSADYQATYQGAVLILVRRVLGCTALYCTAPCLIHPGACASDHRQLPPSLEHW